MAILKQTSHFEILRNICNLKRLGYENCDPCLEIFQHEIGPMFRQYWPKNDPPGLAQSLACFSATLNISAKLNMLLVMFMLLNAKWSHSFCQHIDGYHFQQSLILVTTNNLSQVCGPHYYYTCVNISSIFSENVTQIHATDCNYNYETNLSQICGPHCHCI